MDASYERRLLRGINLPINDIKNSQNSPTSPIKVQRYSDRFTPIRESSNWDIRFNMIQVCLTNFIVYFICKLLLMNFVLFFVYLGSA